MISLILLKLFTFSQILQGVPKLSHATVAIYKNEVHYSLMTVKYSINRHNQRMKKTQPQSKQVWKKTSCGIKTLLVFYIHLFSVWRLSADHWKPGAVSSVRSFKAGCLFKWDRSLCMWVMVVFWSTAASDLRDAQHIFTSHNPHNHRQTPGLS